ncbi:pilin N-terminal domain-containing protein [Lactococcus taiwanensis]|uniref:pilin N-terminal domain-containing protein n=1 Tax=Lactococcus taiwanensis TaxID=1151742 RepID=UPI003511B0B7
MMHKMKYSWMILLFFLGNVVFIKNGLAEEEHTQQLVIVKYGLTAGATGFIPSQTTDDGQKINNLPIDNLGNQLSPMAGIHYIVQQFVPTGAARDVATENPKPSTYRLVGSPQELVTDKNGMATTMLPNGDYLISEQPNPMLKLSQASPPVVVRLPLPDTTGIETKDTVYLYPKSSVDPAEFITSLTKQKGSRKLKDTQIQQTNIFEKYLPKTGVKISILMGLLGFSLLLGDIILMKKRR